MIKSKIRIKNKPFGLTIYHSQITLNLCTG